MTKSAVAFESIRWYVTLSLFAWLMYPLIFRSLAGLRSRGLALVRPLGLLLAAVVPWWLSAVGLVAYTTALIIVVPVVIGVATWIWELRRGEILRFFVEERARLVTFELVAAILFVGYVIFRCFNPAIQHTEKPMELTFLNSLIHTRSMPPPDPWFLGKSINYYYLGYLLVALPARVTSIAASHAFNLGLATIFATAVVAVVGIAADLASSLRRATRTLVVLSGALAGIFLVGIGNLVTPIAFIQHPLRTIHAQWWVGVGWNASRVIVDGPNQQTINEFPAFSFVLGDLHPHVLAFPMFISAIGVGLALASGGKDRQTLLPAAALAGVVGAALYATNSWDMPPAMLLAVVGIVITTIGLNWRERAVPLGALALSAIVIVLPFWLNYTPAIGLQDESVPASIRNAPVVGRLVDTIGIVTWPRSSTAEIFKVHGLFLGISALFLIIVGIPVARRRNVSSTVIVGSIAGLFVLSVLIRFPGLFWFVGPAVLATSLAITMTGSAPKRYLVALMSLAFILLSVTELIFLQDAFGNRMNTVFKLYFQVWAIFAVSTAVALPVALSWLRTRLGRLATWSTAGAFSVVILGAALYPPISAYHWTNGFDQSSGVNGLSYLAKYAPNEQAAITWLRENSTPADHILEAPGCSYGEDGVLPDNLFSMATGLQTPLGWQFHEFQWRLGDPAIANEINQRKSDVAAIYNDPTSTLAQGLLNEYAIRFIIVGPIERYGYGGQCDGGAPYSAEGLSQMDQIGWTQVFRNADVTIYERP